MLQFEYVDIIVSINHISIAISLVSPAIQRRFFRMTTYYILLYPLYTLLHTIYTLLNHVYTVNEMPLLLSINEIGDRTAIESQISEFGQIPKQLFTTAHPRRSPMFPSPNLVCTP